jgi:hypothetical protein
MTEKFESGDRIRCTDNSGDPSSFHVGGEYVVLSIWDGDFVNVEADDLGDKNGMYDYRFELIKDEDAMNDEVKVGDIITVTEDCTDAWFTYGKHYEVLSLRVDGQVEARDDDGDIMALTEREYRKVPPTARFVTMWDYGHSFHPTGDKPFLTKEAAEAHALEVLNSGEHTSGTIAVFEVASKHTVALAVTSEAA